MRGKTHRAEQPNAVATLELQEEATWLRLALLEVERRKRLY